MLLGVGGEGSLHLWCTGSGFDMACVWCDRCVVCVVRLMCVCGVIDVWCVCASDVCVCVCVCVWSFSEGFRCCVCVGV